MPLIVQAIISGLQQSVREFKGSIEGVSARDVLELMLVTQYFDMLREVGNHKSNIILSPAEGLPVDVGSTFRKALLEAGAVQKMER
jgi:hypothetical protein